jgi:hypothetical protein
MSYSSNMAGVTVLPKGCKPIAPEAGKDGKQPGRDERRAYGTRRIWGVKCRSDVTGTKKNLNVQWNSRPKADRQYNGIEFKEQADARAEGIGRELGKARLDSKTRRNYRKLVMARGEAHADAWLRRILG